MSEFVMNLTRPFLASTLLGAIGVLGMLHLSAPLVEGMDKLQETFVAQQGLLEAGDQNIAAGESSFLYVIPARHETSTNYTQQEPARQIAPTTEFATTIPADTRLEVASVSY